MERPGLVTTHPVIGWGWLNRVQTLRFFQVLEREAMECLLLQKPVV
jgi:hypothetical protein